MINSTNNDTCSTFAEGPKLHDNKHNIHITLETNDGV